MFIYVSISVICYLLSKLHRHTTLTPPLSDLSSLSFSLHPTWIWDVIEWGVSRAPIHLDTSGGALAGWQHGAGREGVDSGESASWAQRLHVSLHSPESSGLHRHAHSPDSVWYVYTDKQFTLAPFLKCLCHMKLFGGVPHL